MSSRLVYTCDACKREITGDGAVHIQRSIWSATKHRLEHGTFGIDLCFSCEGKMFMAVGLDVLKLVKP